MENAVNQENCAVEEAKAAEVIKRKLKKILSENMVQPRLLSLKTEKKGRRVEKEYEKGEEGEEEKNSEMGGEEEKENNEQEDEGEDFYDQFNMIDCEGEMAENGDEEEEEEEEEEDDGDR
jgi:hypothetical protein